jgi:hypothetical protein
MAPNSSLMHALNKQADILYSFIINLSRKCIQQGDDTIDLSDLSERRCRDARWSVPLFYINIIQ